MSIQDILLQAKEYAASDVHICVGLPPMLRVDGDLVPVAGRHALSETDTAGLLLTLLSPEQLKAFEVRGEIDLAYESVSHGRYRMNIFRQRNGIEAAIRLIPERIPEPEELGLPHSVIDLAGLSRGLILVCGPTGSGKSTTIASLIGRINQSRSANIITIEDPIEYIHQHQKCLVRQREVGDHTQTFASALRHALRQDPDVILVGEMRDLETTALAITAAETGHLCFATLHTGQAKDTIDRIIDIFPSSQQDQVRIQLSAVLKGVVSQVLLKRIGGGRIAAFEVMLVDSAISSMIRDGKIHLIPSYLETGNSKGMVTLDRYLAELVNSGLVSMEEAQTRCIDPGLFRECLSAGPLTITHTATKHPGEKPGSL